MNALYVEKCACDLPTEMRVVTKEDRSQTIETEVAAQVERKMRDFSESREEQDKLMERFMKALLEKSAQSAEFRKVVSEIGASLSETKSPALEVQKITVNENGSVIASHSFRWPL